MGTGKSNRTGNTREQAFNSLPPAIRANLTEEEKRVFLHEEVWPESLCAKLSDFLYPLDPGMDCDGELR